MTKKITISVPNNLYEKMERWRESFNFSKVFQDAISNEIQKKERFQVKRKERKTLKKIFKDGDFSSVEGRYQTGKEIGFAFARTAPYLEIKQYEKYMDGWKNQDRDTLEDFVYSLDIVSFMDRFGLKKQVNKNNILDERDIVSSSFSLGFMDGIAEFIKGEFTPANVRRDLRGIILKRQARVLTNSG